MRILIIGGGEVGALTATRLIREGNEIVIIEENPERCAHLEESLDAKVLCGSGASFRTLRRAGLHDAEMLIAVSNVDHVNILACLIAQVESRAKIKVLRLRTHEVDHWDQVFKHTNLKVDLIIHPETEIAERILRVVRVPGVSDVIDFAEGRVKVFGMNIEASNWAAGKTIEDLDRAHPPHNTLMVMIFRGSQVIIPHGTQVLQPGDHVYIVTRDKELQAVYDFMGLKTQDSIERVFIIGGKQVGIQVAQKLENQGVNVKLFEKNGERCDLISQILKKTVVLHADGTDEGVLTEENIEGVNAFLALTGHDEDNLIASLLARRLGAKKVVALINRLNYLPMAQRLGVNTTVSPRLAAVDRILQFVRQGRVLSVTTFREEEAEAIELIAAPDSNFVGKSLKELRLPRDTIVGAIVRPDGEILIPRGDAVIHGGDRVIFFALETTIPQLESLFLTKRRRLRK